MKIDKINKDYEGHITHFEVNISRFELLILASALENLIGFYKIHYSDCADIKKIENMFSQLKENFP